MTSTALALVGFATWTLALLGVIGTLRAFLSVTGRRAPNSFRPDGTDVSPFAARLARAHANCIENLPIFSALALVAMATGRTPVTDPAALVFLAARVAQSSVHLISTSNRAVQLRFAFFSVQIVIYLWWAVALLGSLL